MGKEDTSNRYSATNDIRGLDGAADFGIIESPNSDVNWSNAAQGQGGERGKKPQGEGHKIEYHMKRTRQSKIYENTIAATKGESGVGISSFHNVHVNRNNGGQGQGSREFEVICHSIYRNKITADNRSTKVWVENFGNTNINCNCKTTSPKDHGKAAVGSSSAQGQDEAGGEEPKGDGLNIRGNDIVGDRIPEAYQNFSNFEWNLKTTNTEDGGSTNQSRITENEITACNGSSDVGIFNCDNVNIDCSNAGQGQGGCEGNEGLLKNKGISHNIDKNTIIAVNSRRVGIQDFGNIKYNCKSIISRILHFFGYSY
ncbi:uncharacterized protein LOC110769997 [Prunus avium]|uniref:Uncharacterized protein LOC110769997 n=1 Tax=Prunus avium TaxID=42229 RepID=A0A6P5TRJ5_PRUAV|nr:uncharacterized protein LOC110769997 [Prunus avium]